MQINDSIHTINAVDFFQFRKKAAVFFSNGGLFEQDLTQKFAHLYRMIQVGNKQDECLKFLKGIYYAEMVQLRGDSYAWQALECLLEKPHMVLTFPEAIEELKRVTKVFSSELEAAFPSTFDTAESTMQYGKKKRELSKYANSVITDGGHTLDDLYDYFFRELVYTNINTGEKDSFETEFAANFTRWHQALGWKGAADLKNITAFEFFTMNESINSKGK